MYSKTVLVGNLGKEPERKTTPNGKVVTTFSLATSTKKDVTEWHNVVCWDKTAELVDVYLKKGSKVMVEGENKTRSWEKDGVKHYRTEVVAYKVVFLDSKPSGDGELSSIPF